MNATTAALQHEHCDLLRMLGYAYLQNGQPERALPLFRLLHAIDAKDVHAAESLACTLLHLQRADQAVAILERLVRDETATPLTWLLRGQALVLLGRMPEAARSMRVFVAVRNRQDFWRAN